MTFPGVVFMYDKKRTFHKELVNYIGLLHAFNSHLKRGLVHTELVINLWIIPWLLLLCKEEDFRMSHPPVHHTFINLDLEFMSTLTLSTS